MENLGKFTTVLLLMILSTIVSAFTFVKLWEWFIIPTFHLIELSISQAIGIMILISYLKMRNEIKKQEGDFLVIFLKNVALVIITSGFSLLFGYVVYLFI